MGDCRGCVPDVAIVMGLLRPTVWGCGGRISGGALERPSVVPFMSPAGLLESRWSGRIVRSACGGITGTGTGVNEELGLSVPMLVGGRMRAVLGPLLRRVCFWSTGMFSLPRGSGRVLVAVTAMGPFVFSRRRRWGGNSSCTGAIERVARRDIGGEDGVVMGIGGGIAVVLRGWDGAVAVS